VLEFDKIFENASANRSEFLKAKWDLEQSNLSVSESYSNIWPSLSLSANHSRSRSVEDLATTMGKPFALNSPKSTITLSFTHDLSNYGSNNAYKNSLTARLKQQIAFDNTRNQLRKEVDSTISTVNNAFKRYTSIINAKKLSLEKLQAEFDRYRLGESSIKNVIDFQKEVNSQEKSDLEGRIAILQALSSLRKIQGLLPEKSDLTLIE
jgi:outer membrane protein TolC